SKLTMKCPASSVFVSRVAPVPCEVTVTVAPEIAEPDLSVTVPRKLPVAWPYVSCPQQAAAIKTTTAITIIVLLISPRPSRQPQQTIIPDSKSGQRTNSCPPQAPVSLAIPELTTKHEMSIRGLSAPQVPQLQEASFDPWNKQCEKLLLYRGCVKRRLRKLCARL